MTLAQFKRMKPKYKFRLIMVCVIGFLLFLGLLKLLALGIGLIRVQMNTSQLPAATAANVLEKPNMNQILEIMDQPDAKEVLVESSRMTPSTTWGGSPGWRCTC